MQPMRLLMAATPVIYALFAYFVSRLFPGAIVAVAWTIIGIGLLMPYLLKRAADISLFDNDRFGSLGYTLFGWCGTDWVLYNFIVNVSSVRDDAGPMPLFIAIMGVAVTLTLVFAIYFNKVSGPRSPEPIFKRQRSRPLGRLFLLVKRFD